MRADGDKVNNFVLIRDCEGESMGDIQSPVTNDSIGLTPVNPAIEDYMCGLLAQTDHPVLIEMEEFARLRGFPIVNRLVGVFLETQARMIHAKRIFEFGSGYGYSAYWFARAVGADGHVICSDANAMNRERAEKYLSAAAFCFMATHRVLYR